MNLRDQLKGILPGILPGNPADAIKGTELIRLVRFSLKEEYSDATLRYHFSIMCCDPASPIAKVEQGQGYYLRRPLMGGATRSMAQARLGLLFETEPEVLDQAVNRQQKLRAIYARDMENAGRFPCLFESSFGPGSPYENVWKCPDAVIVDWEAGELTDHGLKLDTHELALKAAMGVAPFHLTSAKFKVEVTHDSYREDFFQTLSHARWSHRGELIIAAPVEDEQLAEELRQLGAEYGIGIFSYGLAPERFETLRPYYEVPKMRPGEFDALLGEMKPQRFSVARTRSVEWRLINEVRSDNAEFQELFRWLQRCLTDGQAWSWQEYCGLESRLENGGE